MFLDGTTQLASLLGGEVVGPPRRGEPAAYDIDSRKLGAGGLFFALPGANVDGHRFLPQLAAAGAWGAVVSDKAAALAAGISAVVVPDVSVALYRLAAARRATLPYPMVAITGTNGKTSTKDFIARLLSRHLRVSSTRGNFNNLLGLPLSLLAADPTSEVGIFELGMSEPGEIDRLAALLEPDFGIITNVSLAHIEGLGSLEAVRQAKGELVPHIARDGVLYLNADDGSSRYFAVRAEGRPVRSVTTRGILGAGVMFRAEEVGLTGSVGEVVLDVPDRGRQLRQTVRWPVPGRHMIYPLLFGLLLAQDLGVEIDLAAWAEPDPAKFGATGGRMRVRPMPGGHVIDDSYNANPASLEAALDFLAEVDVPGRRFAVLGDMLELAGVSEVCHRAVVDRLAGDPQLAGAWLIGDEFAAAARASGLAPGRIRFGGDRDAAADELAGEVGEGDVVLVKASRGIGLDKVADRLCGEAPC